MNTSQRLSDEELNDKIHGELETSWGDWVDIFNIIKKYNLTINRDDGLIEREGRCIYDLDYSCFSWLFKDVYDYWLKHFFKSTLIEESGFVNLRC